MQYWQRSTGSFKSIVIGLLTAVGLGLLLLAPLSRTQGCGPVERIFHGYSFLNPAIVNAEAKAAPFFLSFEEIYRQFGGQEKVQIEDNIAEWRQRFCNLPAAQDIYQIVYKADLNTMERIRIAALNPRIQLDVVLENNTFARHLVRDHCLEVIDYLVFAKRCERHVTPSADPWEETPRDRAAMEELIEEGVRLFPDLESHYVRLRYAYQLIRLAHYAGLYQHALDLYDRLMPMVDNDPSIIEYWIEGHRAGALLKVGRHVEASYLYSRIFENCPSKRESAFRSFRIQTDEEWRQCLLLCQSDEERATLYALRARDADSRAVEEMEKIYDLDPQNEHLEILLVREMKKLEQNLLGLDFNDKRAQNKAEFNIPRPWAGDYVIAMQAFVRRVAGEGQVARPVLWKIAEGYLELLAGEYYYAARTFANARSMLNRRQQTLGDQLAKFELALRISAWERMADSVEIAAAEIMRNNLVYRQDSDFRDFLGDKMADLYDLSEEPGMAFLCRFPLQAMRPNPQQELINNLLAVAGKKDPNRFEKALLETSKISNVKSDLLDMQAVLYLSQMQPEAALETLKDMEPEWDNYGLFNPFVERIHDNVSRPLPSNVRTFNRRELIERLLDLEYQAKSGVSNADSIYYQLGLAWYNMSYFGHSWKAMDYFRSGASLSKWNLTDGDNIVPHYYYPFGNRENFDCSRALYYFEKTRLLADDPEIAARATYMAAKCERNAYYVNRFREGTTRTYEHFQLLEENYADTKFYQRVIKECKTFEAYVARRL